MTDNPCWCHQCEKIATDSSLLEINHICKRTITIKGWKDQYSREKERQATRENYTRDFEREINGQLRETGFYEDKQLQYLEKTSGTIRQVSKKTSRSAVHKYSRVNPDAVSKENVAGSLVHRTDITKVKQEHKKNFWN